MITLKSLLGAGEVSGMDDMIPYDDKVTILDVSGEVLTEEDLQTLEDETYDAYEEIDAALRSNTEDPVPDCEEDFEREVNRIIKARKGK